MKKLSLRLRFIIYFFISIIITWLLATGITYILSQQILKEVFDSQQVLFAKRLASLDINRLFTEDNELTDIKSKAIKRFDYDDDILSFAIFDYQGQRIFHDDEDGEDFIFNPELLKYKDPVYMEDTKKWRIIWLKTKSHTIIAVGQENEYREEMAEKMAFSQAIPWLIMLFILMIITFFTISRELLPLNKLAKQIKKREPDDSTLINNKVPKEVQPFIDALNALFVKISEMIARERRFTENAAHELRSPLTALRIQAEVAQLSNINSSQQKTALHNLTLGIDRASHLIDQLLTLSRLDSESKLVEYEPISWQTLINSAIHQIQPLADNKNISISYEKIVDNKNIEGNPLFLSLLLGNLLDNAIKYCPKNSHISIMEKNQQLIIEDNGQGVTQEVLLQLGDRFYRPAGMDITGSGLGISIVKQIITLHHWSIQFYIANSGGLGIDIGLKKLKK